MARTGNRCSIQAMSKALLIIDIQMDYFPGGRMELVDSEVAGMMTHMCVDTTVRAGFDLGWPMVLASDACATKGLAFAGRSVEAGAVQAAYLAALDGTFAQVLPAASILDLDPA